MAEGFESVVWAVDDLPPELLAHVFSCFDHGDLLSASLVSRKFEEVANENFLWRNQVLDLLPSQLTKSAESIDALFAAAGVLGSKNELPRSIRAPEWKFHFARALRSFLPDRPTAERISRLIRAKIAKGRFEEFTEIKIAFLGEPKIGRTSHLIHYSLGASGLTADELVQYSPPKDKLGITHVRVNASRDGKECPKRVSLRIWEPPTGADVGGNAHRAINMSLKGCDGVFVGFDLSRTETFEAARDKWIPLVRKKLLDVPIILVGLKDDLPFLRTEGGIPRDPTSPEFRKSMNVDSYCEQNTTIDMEDVIYDAMMDLIFQ